MRRRSGESRRRPANGAVAGTALAMTLALGAAGVAWSANHHGVARNDGASLAGPVPTTESVVSTLGAVPIPHAPPAPSASPLTVTTGHPQMQAMGVPVRAKVGGADVMVTALGPTQRHTGGGAAPAKTTPSTIDIRLEPHRGRMHVGAAQFSSRDETGKLVPLHAVGPAAITVSAAGSGGGERTLRFRGRYDNGSAQLTWRQGGHILAVWVFTIELD